MRARPYPFLITGLAAILGIAGAGCENMPEDAKGGPESQFLTSQAKMLAAGDFLSSSSLLPLSQGATWHMLYHPLPHTPRQSIKDTSIDIRVASVNANIPGVGKGALLEVRRDGNLWRREVYQVTPTDLSLLAVAEENRPYMVYTPAIPLLHYPAQEGWSRAWNGRFSYKGHTFPANALSRITTTDSIYRPDGTTTEAYRVDTLIIAHIGADEVNFPTIRWLAPGTGFIQRGFIEHGRLCIAALSRIEQQGKPTRPTKP